MIDQNTSPQRELLKEITVMYVLVFLVVLILALLAMGVGFVAANLYALVAAAFIGAPYWWLQRKNLSLDDFGLSFNNWQRSALWGILFTVATFPLFLAGQYVWEAHLRNRKVHFAQDNYWRWPVELEGRAQNWGQEPGGWIWSEKDRLYFGIRGSVSTPAKLIVHADTPFRPRSDLGGIVMRPLDEKGNILERKEHLFSKHWEFLAVYTSRRVSAYLTTPDEKGSGPRKITVEVKALSRDGEPQKPPPWKLKLGPVQSPHPSPYQGERGLMWMLLWAITQLFFIALPEEYFYRGYLQTRLGLYFANRYGSDEEPDWLGFTPSIFVTSILFGIGHLLIPVEGVLLASRFSVFFPSLLFGWLRRRTGSIVGPVIYHACCNLMVLYMVIHYG